MPRIDEDDNGSIVPSPLINEATHCRPELLIARPGGSAQTGIRNPKVEANLEIDRIRGNRRLRSTVLMTIDGTQDRPRGAGGES